MRLPLKLKRSFLLFLCTLFASAFSSAEPQDNISEMNVDKATREVDRKVIPDNFQWVVRKKSDIRKENGELIEDPFGTSSPSLNETADDLPPCTPRSLTASHKR